MMTVGLSEKDRAVAVGEGRREVMEKEVGREEGCGLLGGSAKSKG